MDIRGKVKYSNFPDLFFGIGNDNQPDDSENFTNQYVKADFGINYDINKKVFAGLHIDAAYNWLSDIRDGGKMTYTDLTGINGGRNIGIGPELLYDTRDNVLYPKNGYFINTSWVQYGKAFGSEYSYHSFIVDVRKYMTLFGDKNVLAMQIKGKFQGGGDIPFYKLAQLGGDDRLRGIEHFNLYTDNNASWFQLEGRRPLPEGRR